MKFSFETKTDVAREKIWRFYSDVNKWFSWEDDLKSITLDGEFKLGTSGIMELEGMPPMKYTLTEVIENKIFTDKTIIDQMGTVYFIHELYDKDNSTIVKHSVEFIPVTTVETEEQSKFLNQIFSDVPTSIYKLIEAAR